jgi:hypothetical protein
LCPALSIERHRPDLGWDSLSGCALEFLSKKTRLVPVHYSIRPKIRQTGRMSPRNHGRADRVETRLLTLLYAASRSRRNRRSSFGLLTSFNFLSSNVLIFILKFATRTIRLIDSVMLTQLRPTRLVAMLEDIGRG